jgi:chromosomal replication initiation ATPase DnaA
VYIEKEKIEYIEYIKNKNNMERVIPTLREREEMSGIKNAVLAYFKISDYDFSSKDRSFDFAIARQYFFYLCDLYLGIKKGKIGYMAGGRDRTTVLYGIKKIENFIEVGSDDARHLDPLRKQMKELTTTTEIANRLEGTEIQFTKSVMIGSHPNKRKIIAEYSSIQKGSLKACL